MATPLLESFPMTQPITTKLSAHDYQALLDRAKIQGINQTTLVRLAIRRYLSETSIKDSSVVNAD